MEEISNAKSLKGAIFLEGKTGSPSRALWDPNDLLWHRNVKEGAVSLLVLGIWHHCNQSARGIGTAAFFGSSQSGVFSSLGKQPLAQPERKILT